MVINFDIFNNPKSPKISLHNMNGKKLDDLSYDYIKEVKISPNLIGVWNFSFTAFYNNETTFYYKLRKKRLIKVENFGVFEILSCNETHEGDRKYKEVECQSIECAIERKDLTMLEGVYKFWNPMKPEGTLLGEIMNMLPNWSVGYVDEGVATISRAYDQFSEKLYTFMMGKVSEDFNCVFQFDTFNRKIKVYDANKVSKMTDIFVNDDNLVKKLQIQENNDEVITCMNVFGGNDLDISLVNPLGGAKIYNYSYWVTAKDETGEYFLSEELRNAITKWDTKYKNALNTYGNLLTNFSRSNTDLLRLQGELIALEQEETRLEGLIIGKGKFNQDHNEESRRRHELEDTLIPSKKKEVTNKQSKIDNITSQMTTINKDVAKENNFTKEQLAELADYESGYTLQNNAFIVTENMSAAEKQEQAQRLFDYAQGQLARASQPNFTFELDLVNFLFLKEYYQFTKQLELGCIIKVEIEKGKIAYPILLGYEIYFDKDKMTNLNMKFGSKLRLTGAGVTRDELFEKAVNSGINLGFNAGGYNQAVKNANSAKEFMNSTLDASKNMYVNSEKQEVLMNDNGVKCRRYNDTTQKYEPKQLMITSDGIARTLNNWDTLDSIYGDIILPNGQVTTGLIGKTIIGNLFIGEELLISNTNNSFSVDGLGAKLTNATLSITNSTGNILFDPTNGFKIQDNKSGSLEDVFYYDKVARQLTMKGTIYSENGVFSGTVTSSKIKSCNIDCGDFKVDNLGNCFANSIVISGNSSFSGDINGSNITGTNINGGTVTGANISGGTINVTTNVNIGDKLILNQYTGGVDTGIQFGGSGTEIYASGEGIYFRANGGYRFDGGDIAVGANYTITIGGKDVATQKWTQDYISQNGSVARFG